MTNKVKIDVCIEEICYCDDGVVVVFDDSVEYSYVCVECDGKGSRLTNRKLTVNQFKRLTGAKDANEI